MRSFGHWTSRYVLDRLAEMGYRHAFPEHPWLTKTANTILDSYLKHSDAGLEFGSGRSTVWFAERVGHLTSVEHDEMWYRRVVEKIEKHGLKNVSSCHRTDKVEKSEKRSHFSSDYVKVLEGFAPNSLNFCLVDGQTRDYCAFGVMEKLCPGGLLIIDNVNWYLPSSSISPNSRTFEQGPKGDVWCAVWESLSNWRKIWTSSGVTDTALFFKPCK